MNLRRVISSLTLAVVMLAIVSGIAWFSMGKRTITQLTTPGDPVRSTRIRASQIHVK